MSKVGPNDPCPCGSGKKYKKCCRLKPGKRDLKISKKTDRNAASISSFFQSTISAQPQNTPVPSADAKENSATQVKDDQSSSASDSDRKSEKTTREKKGDQKEGKKTVVSPADEEVKHPKM